MEARRRGRSAEARPRGKTEGARAWAPYVLTAVLIWLAWQIIVSLLVQRGPVDAAIAVAPGSAQVLSRAAEAELVAGRPAQARDLAVMALRAAPFDVRSVRVLGLAIAGDDEALSDELLTLAGNWSLRDDPSHAWLIDRRLRQGDYAGAFGHADLLARRRPDLHPTLFRLFTVAVAEDPRSAGPLVSALRRRPNWRAPYLASLMRDPRGPAAQAVLAQGLAKGPGRLDDIELGDIYLKWIADGRLTGVDMLRARTGRPGDAVLRDGGFDATPAPRPFRWHIEAVPGVFAEIMHVEGSRGGGALFVETDGFGVGQVVYQYMRLAPGPYLLQGDVRFEAGGRDPRMDWEVFCIESGQVVGRWRPTGEADATDWSRQSDRIEIPGRGCTVQWLRLTTFKGPRRQPVVVWFDDLRVVRPVD